jgi:hypothetical protein
MKLATTFIEDFAPAAAPLETINGKPAIRLPGDGRLLSEFAEELGTLLAGEGVFARKGVAFILDAEAQALAPATSGWLRTWAERAVVPYRARVDAPGAIIVRSMAKDVADAVLAAPQFLEKLPRVERIHPCPMPWLREDGRIELLEPGLDAGSGTLTLDPGFTLEPLPLGEARMVLEILLEEFCFAEDRGRSKAAHIGAMLTVFAGGIMPTKSIKPCFIYVGNAPGSGKTTLAQTAGVPYCEPPSAEDAPTDNAEWGKKLLAVVMSGRRLILLDNVKGRLNSTALEAYLTSPSFSGRVLGANREFTGEAGATVLLTGNDLQWTPDLRRRSLAVELFMRELRAEDRTFRRTLTPATFAAIRRDALCAMWGLVVAWDRADRPKGTRRNSSFPEWCDTIAGVVEFAGWACPSAPAELEGMGDTDTADFAALAEAMEAGREYAFAEMVELASGLGAFEALVLQIEEGGKASSGARNRLARILSRFNGRRATAAGHFVCKGKGHARRFSMRVVHE